MSRYASWGIIIDDIVFPDGRTSMGVLGGGGLYAAIGMRLWGRDVILISAVGHDFELNSLEPFGLDGVGLLVTDLPTPRAWQLFEEDGRRTQIFRVPDEVWHKQLVLPPSSKTIPSTLQAAHFIGRGDPDEEKWVLALKKAGVRLSAEPIIDESTTSDEVASIKRCLKHFELFSPGTSEAKVLAGHLPVKEQLQALAALGPRVVALRQGASGSILYDRDADQFWRIPAAEASVVDVTGAGNAYCGGLLTGWIETGNINQAAARATVSAAMVIEQVGPPRIDETIMSLAQRRAEKVLAEIQPLDDFD